MISPFPPNYEPILPNRDYISIAMTIKNIRIECADSNISLDHLYLEISRIRDRAKIYNSPTGYFGKYRPKGNQSWTERLPKKIDMKDAYLLLCLDKNDFGSMQYTSFCPDDFGVEKPDSLNFEIDIFEIKMEVDWN